MRIENQLYKKWLLMLLKGQSHENKGWVLQYIKQKLSLSLSLPSRKFNFFKWTLGDLQKRFQHMLIQQYNIGAIN